VWSGDEGADGGGAEEPDNPVWSGDEGADGGGAEEPDNPVWSHSFAT